MFKKMYTCIYTDKETEIMKIKKFVEKSKKKIKQMIKKHNNKKNRKKF